MTSTVEFKNSVLVRASCYMPTHPRNPRSHYTVSPCAVDKSYIIDSTLRRELLSQVLPRAPSYSSFGRSNPGYLSSCSQQLTLFKLSYSALNSLLY